MMGTCSNCKKKTGIILNYNPCEYGNCNKQYCNKCAKTHLKGCPICDDGWYYCSEHLGYHEHHIGRKGQEISFTTNKEYAVIRKVHIIQDLEETIKLEKQGYKLITINENCIILKKEESEAKRNE